MASFEFTDPVARLAPLDGKSVVEFVVLSDHLESDMVEINGSGDGTALRYYDLQ